MPVKGPFTFCRSLSELERIEVKDAGKLLHLEQADQAFYYHTCNAYEAGYGSLFSK